MKPKALPAGLFVEAAKLTSRKEDLFTLALASALSESANMGRGFVEILFGAKTVQGVSLRSATLEFEIQVIPSKECRLDMLIRMNGAALIALEHKLWSPEGNNQVSKYLCLPKRVAPLVAYVAGYYATRLSGVDIAPKRYLRHPSKRLHFVWADFTIWSRGQDVGNAKIPPDFRLRLTRCSTNISFSLHTGLCRT